MASISASRESRSTALRRSWRSIVMTETGPLRSVWITGPRLGSAPRGALRWLSLDGARPRAAGDADRLRGCRGTVLRRHARVRAGAEAGKHGPAGRVLVR